MIRHTSALQILPGQSGAFRTGLGKLWPELCRFLDEKNVHNFSIWNAEQLVFIYGESGSIEEGEEAALEINGPARAMWSPEDQARIQKILQPVADCMTWISAPWEVMRLMYHDLGIVRENKELIRHRMFMTELKAGCAEEYKRRHDGLVQARGDKIDPGPDSNFTIWSDGHYIFGYNEIDTTMEKEPDEAGKRSVRAWETRQLEIMDWITNDCDALFDTHHAACVCLAHH